MDLRRDAAPRERRAERPTERGADDPAITSIDAGTLLRMLGSLHRVLALLDGRVLLMDVRSHHAFLIQEDDGSLQLPRIALVEEMVRSGKATPAGHGDPDPSSSQRMRTQIAMLDAAEVPQGEKSIFIHLATHWTQDLEARFGPFDDAAKIRRWRTALRRAARRPGKSLPADARR